MVDFGLADAWAGPGSPTFLLLLLGGQLSDIVIRFLRLEVAVIVEHDFILREYLLVLHDCFLQVQLHSVGLILLLEPIDVDSLGQLLGVLVTVDKLLQVLLDEVALGDRFIELGVAGCLSVLLAREFFLVNLLLYLFF